MLRKKLTHRILSLFTAAVTALSVLSAPVVAYGELPEPADNTTPAVAETVTGYTSGNAAIPGIGHIKPVMVKAPAGILDPDDLVFPDESDEPTRDELNGTSWASDYILSQLTTPGERAFYLAMKAQFDEFLMCKKDARKYIIADGRKNYYIAPIAYEGMALERAFDIFLLFYYTEPQYYFLRPTIEVWTKDDDGYDAIAPCILNSTVKASDRAKYEAAIDRTVSEWLPQIESQVTVLAKESKIVELICSNIEYDYESLTVPFEERDDHDQGLIGALCERCCVCAGYAKAVEYLCCAVGIEALQVTSDSHAWNVVKLYDNWYSADTTWADSGDTVNRDFINVSYDRLQELDPSGAHVYDYLWDDIELPETVLNEVAVPDLGLVDIRVTSEPVEKSCVLNGTPDLTGGVITAYFASSTKGEYTEEIPMTSPDVTVTGSTDKVGLATFTAEYGGYAANFTIVVYDPQKMDVTVSSDNYFSSFVTLSEAFAAIDKRKDANAIYNIAVNRDISEKKLNFPKYTKNIRLISFGGATVEVKDPKLALKSPFELGCTIKSTKPINVTVPQNCMFTVDSGNTVFGAIKGTGTSEFYAEHGISAVSISTFAKVGIPECVTLTGKFSGIGNFYGKVILGPDSSMNVKHLGDAQVELCANVDKNGRLAVPKLTVEAVIGAASVLVTASDGRKLPDTGTPVMYVTNAKAFRHIHNITIIGESATGKKLSPVLYGKEIRAENTNALTLEYTAGADTVKKGFSTFEKLFEALTDANTVYTITVSGEIAAEKFSLPKNIGGLVIRGGKITIPGGTLSVKYALTFRDTQITATNKKGAPAPLTIKTASTLTLSNARFTGEPVNLLYKQLIIE